ncbi:hypothetical protein O6H91_11G027700 [Diphasiastrum complanatum]|uniref:Uncharacterized protein n=1 Tax=Diphasiastrum complanatum TaxID=34168 RepID=A0ACC2C7B2_DIPCM|nr:hypothetical protein O6H91_11G027700 [Diphasiastrum complanatum]
MGRHPEVVWAQRSDKVFLTVELPDAKNPVVKFEPDGKFLFSATVGSEDQPYEIILDLFGKVNTESSKVSVGSRNILCIAQKNETGWWKRLLSSEGKPPPYVKVDWNKWVDEDEEKESKLDNFDMGGMNDYSSYDAGEDEADSDDEGMLYDDLKFM